MFGLESAEKDDIHNRSPYILCKIIKDMQVTMIFVKIIMYK